MQTIIFIAAGVLLLILVAGLWQRQYLNRITHERVMVHSTSGDTLEGLLTGNYRDGITLDDAKDVQAQKSITVAGTVFIPRNRIRFMQTAIYEDSE